METSISKLKDNDDNVLTIRGDILHSSLLLASDITLPTQFFENRFSFFFTNAGITGRNGPTLQDIQSVYNTLYWPTVAIQTQGIQLWTVPITGTYQIISAGACGGGLITNRSNPGRGIIIHTSMPFTAGTVLKILVGQKGITRPLNNDRGTGGGGTFITYDDNTPILIAGGGGGSGNTIGTGGSFGTDAVPGRNGTAATTTNGGGAGGTNGSGGEGSKQPNGAGAAGGGGLLTNGGNNTNNTAIGGTAFILGGTGGTTDGGFGGGGGRGGLAGGGGGGGYSGGGGGNTIGSGSGGGGGGSFDINNPATATRYTLPINGQTGGFNTGDGFVLVNFTDPLRMVEQISAQWATRCTGTSNYRVTSIAVDSSGNVYITGSYQSNPLTVYNSDGTLSGITLPNSGFVNCFIVKYNTSGVAQWATRCGGTVFDVGNSIAVDSSGSVYITGTYESNPLTIYNAGGASSGITLPLSGSTDCFIVKYNTSGVAQWATRCAGGSNGKSIAVDSSGSVYITGSYNANPLTIYNAGGTLSGITLPLSGFVNCFIVKYNTSGVAQWATRCGGTVFDIGNSIAVDSSGSVYITGYYQSNPLTIYNAGGASSGITLPLSGFVNCFIVKYNTSGVAQWATRCAGAGDDRGNSVAMDSSGSVYITGFYTSNPLTIFNSGGASSGITLPLSGSTDCFIVKYNTTRVLI